MSATDRGKAKAFNLLKTIEAAINIYSNETAKNKIDIKIKGSESLIFIGYESDFYQIIINLFSNSLYWMTRSSKEAKVFSVEIFTDKGELDYIDIKDTGPGIEKHILDSHALFEPGFSAKPGGTGIGLSIAGEAALRNNLELVAFESSCGAYFRLQTKEI